MVEYNVKAEDLGADMKVPEGCPTCGGVVSLRVHQRVAGNYCGSCRRTWRSMLRMTPKGLVVMNPLSAA